MDSAKRTDYEKKGRVGCGCVDGTGSIGDGNSTGCASGGINRIVSSAIVGDESEAGGEVVDEFLVETASHLGRDSLSASRRRMGLCLHDW